MSFIFDLRILNTTIIILNKHLKAVTRFTYLFNNYFNYLYIFRTAIKLNLDVYIFYAIKLMLF